jgi:hypothetical protein
MSSVKAITGRKSPRSGPVPLALRGLELSMSGGRQPFGLPIFRLEPWLAARSSLSFASVTASSRRLKRPGAAGSPALASASIQREGEYARFLIICQENILICLSEHRRLL